MILWKGKPIGHDANQRERRSVESTRRPTDAGVAGKLVLPDRVANHHDRRRARSLVLFEQEPTKDWRHTRDAESRRRHLRQVNGHGRPIHRPQVLDRPECGDIVQRRTAGRAIRRIEDERRSLHDFFEWRDQLLSLNDVAAFRTVERNLRMVDGPSVPVDLAETTAAGFRVARVPPILGRFLLEEDERPGAPPVVVIGHSVWQNQFASDPGVVGRRVLLDGAPLTLIGVMPDGFAFPKNHRFWTPLRARPSDYARRQGPAIFIFGRLAPGVTVEAAQAELTVFGRGWRRRFRTHTRNSSRWWSASRIR